MAESVFVLDIIEDPESWEKVAVEVAKARPDWNVTWTPGKSVGADMKVRDTFHILGAIKGDSGLEQALGIALVFEEARKRASDQIGRVIPPASFRNFKSWESRVPKDV